MQGNKSDDREDQFRSLTRLSAILNSSLNPIEVQKRAMEAATELMKAETGSLLLLDEKSNELYFEVALGEKGSKIKEIRLKMGEGIAGWVALNGRSLLINDTAADPRWSKKSDKSAGFVTRNVICTPLNIKDRTIGVLQAINKTDGVFTDNDMELFEMLANQVAIAVENARLVADLKHTFYEFAEALAEAIEQRDPYTGGHTRRVLNYSVATAEYMGISGDTLEQIRLSAVLHDIGKIGVEDRVLRKHAGLDSEELAQMQTHPQKGTNILEHIEKLKNLIPGMRHHHERYDGKGYPDGLRNGDIPLPARIISVADTFDAMTSDRPYRKGLPDEIAVKELQKYSGIQFDPEVVEAFVAAHRDGKIISCSIISCQGEVR